MFKMEKEKNSSIKFLISMQSYFLQMKYEKQYALFPTIIIFIYFISWSEAM